MACDDPWHDRLWRFLQSPFGRGLAAVGMLFGPMDAGMFDNPWARAPEAEGTVFLYHPERVRADIPLSPLEAELARELGSDRGPARHDRPNTP